MKTNLLRRIACLLTVVLLVNGSGFRSFAAGVPEEGLKTAVTADSNIDLADDEIKATSVTVSPATLRLAPGEKRALTATILPLEASLNKIDASANSMDASLNRVTWKSTDESIAKVYYNINEGLAGEDPTDSGPSPADTSTEEVGGKDSEGNENANYFEATARVFTYGAGLVYLTAKLPNRSEEHTTELQSHA